MQIDGVNINADNVMDKLIEENNKRRIQIEEYNKELISEKNKCINYEKLIDEQINNGRLRIKYKETEYESFFVRQVSDGEKKKLYVILNGYRKANIGAVFKRWSWYTFMDGDLLNIDDPMCNKDYPELCLGWYWGSKEISYRHEIVEIVKQFAAKYRYTKIVYYASSGGGAAAIHCAQIHEESTAIVINPQIDLSLHGYYPQFREITRIDVLAHDTFNRNNMWDMKSFTKSNFILCENTLAKSDRIQISNLLKKMEIKEINMGINRISQNSILWLYEAEGISPHDSQEWPTMFMPIAELDKLFLDKNNSEKINDEVILNNYLSLTKLWYERFHAQQEIRRINRKLLIIRTPSIFLGNNEMERKLFAQRLTLNKEDNIYTHLRIPFVLETNTRYVLRIGCVEVEGKDDVKIAHFAIKDEIFNQLMYKEKIEDNCTVLFVTGEDTEKIELRIYPGNIGESNGLSMNVYGVSIYKW